MEKKRISVVLLYNTCCIYEIVITNYFLKYTNHQMVFASMDGKSIIAQEGFSINVDCALRDINAEDVELFIVPGGNIKEIDKEEAYAFIRAVVENKQLVAGICNGVDELDHAGVLAGIDSTHSVNEDIVVTDYVITSRANMYVDFAIEIGKKLHLFTDEADLQETIDFWKMHKHFE